MCLVLVAERKRLARRASRDELDVKPIIRVANKAHICMRYVSILNAFIAVCDIQFDIAAGILIPPICSQTSLF
jgi:hypothetical protein